jgi:hypothetical protein
MDESHRRLELEAFSIPLHPAQSTPSWEPLKQPSSGFRALVLSELRRTWCSSAGTPLAHVPSLLRVRLGLDEQTGERVALKCLKKKEMGVTADVIKQVEREIHAMSKIEHQNVIRLKDVDWNCGP